MEKLPKHFRKMQNRYPALMEALDRLGQATDQAGPLDEKTAHLIQLAAAGALRLEGAVHSHARRAKALGATAEEIRHALVLLVPTAGYPAVAAALSWVDDVLED